MKRQPTNLGYALLGLLHSHTMSGYDLRKVFATTALGNYSSSPGAIYPALARLEALALIEGEIDSAKALRPRKLYRLTDQGRSALVAWLSQEIQPEDVMKRLDELMLRFAFHSILGSNSATREFLHGFHRRCENYADELESQREIFPPEVPIHSLLALEAGIEQYRASARWARNAAQHFGKTDT